MPILAQPPSATPATSPKQPGLTVDGILAMVEAGLSDDVIVARLRTEDKAFDLSADDMIRIKKARVSDAVLKVMLDPKAVSKPEGGTAASPEPVVIRSPVIPGIAAINPSGATPASRSLRPG